MSAHVVDYVVRQKFGRTSLNFFFVKQFPILLPMSWDPQASWDSRAASTEWTTGRVRELVYTAWDMQPFALDLGDAGPPFRWDPERRFLLRCELDAAFFHLYSMDRDDVDYIMDTFPIVRRKDEAAHGEYRTKRVILEIYDAMAAAIETGEPYPTRLDPPPADDSLRHPHRDG